LFIVGVIVAYLHSSLLLKLRVEPEKIPLLSNEQITLYEKVCEELVQNVSEPNSVYIRDIYQSGSNGDIRVEIGYYSTNFMLVYRSGKILMGICIDDKFERGVYLFNKEGRLYREADF